MGKLLIAFVVLLVCGPVAAQTTAPSGEATGRAIGRGARGMTPEERQATMIWAGTNMPDLVRFIREYGQGRGGVPLFALIRARMTAMEEAPPDPMVRERMRRNIMTENQIGQYLIEMQSATPEQRTAIQDKIRTVMQQNVEGFLNDRQERIDRLKARLEEEQKSLEADRKSLDQLVTRRLMPFRLALPRGDAGAPPSEPVNAAPTPVPAPAAGQ